MIGVPGIPRLGQRPVPDHFIAPVLFRTARRFTTAGPDPRRSTDRALPSIPKFNWKRRLDIGRISTYSL